MARYLEELTEEKKAEIKKRLDVYLKQYHDKPGYQDEEIELDDLDVVPYKVWKYLEELGWDKVRQDENGWQLDFQLHFQKKNEPMLTLSGSGIFGGLDFMIQEGI